MRRPPGVSTLLIALAVLLASASAVGPAALAQPGDAGLCRILSVDEVAEVLGPEPWQIADDGDVADQCYMHNGLFDTDSEALSVRVRRSNEENQQEFRADILTSPGATELEIDGLPAIQRDGKEVTVYFPDPWDILQITVIGTEGQDLTAEVTRLAELAVPRYRSGASASPDAGQESPGASGAPALALCEVWPAELLQELLGEPVAMAASDPVAGTCRLQADGSFTGLTAGITHADEGAGPLIDQTRAGLPGAVDIDIEGTPALLVPPVPMTGDAETHARSSLFAFPDTRTMLQLELTAPAAIDAQSALLVLASVALPQLGSITPLGDTSPAPSSAGPSAAARTGLAALAPAEIGDGEGPGLVSSFRDEPAEIIEKLP